MERFIMYIVIILILGGGFFLFFTCEYFQDLRTTADVHQAVDSLNVVQELHKSVEVPVKKEDSQEIFNFSPENVPLYSEKRITKKPFGIFVSPTQSPVAHERFEGYHTGTDFEIFDDEYNADINVPSICDGPVVMTQYVNGYGGTVIQACTFNGDVVRVLYGHLKLQSIAYVSGNLLKINDVIGVLGANESMETDGERKHLHLSIHKGIRNDLRGYVAQEKILDQWIDPCSVISCAQ